jgi:hypothetical protein
MADTPGGADVEDSTVPQRFEEPTDYERGVHHGRRVGAYGALATARRALRQTSAVTLARILDQLVSVDDLGETLRQLEDAADRAGQP